MMKRVLSLAAMIQIVLMFSVLIGLFATDVGAAPDTSAPIAVVMDFYTGEILYSRDMHRRWIPASLTKSMTAFIVYEEIEAGNLTLETLIPVSAEAARFSADRRQQGTFIPIPGGTYVTVEMLLRLMMIPSSNGACVVMAEHISGSEAAFVERMNETAAAMGMYTSFTNSHGAMVHHTDAYSMIILVREFILRFPDVLRITAMPNVTFNGTTHPNTNHHVSRTQVYGVDGFKTGSLRQAGWNHSVTAERDERRIIAVVMNTPTNAARHSESRVLIDFGFEELIRRETELSERVRIFFNGRLIPLDTSPEVRRGRLLLPLRSMFEPMDYTVEWHDDYRLVVLSGTNGNTATLFVGRNLAVINGETVAVHTQIINDRLYIPKEFIEMVTGTAAEWNEATGVVQFRS